MVFVVFDFLTMVLGFRVGVLGFWGFVVRLWYLLFVDFCCRAFGALGVWGLGF